MDLAPYTLIVTFIGLITFVPIEKNDQLEAMWVLLPNASDGEGPCIALGRGDTRPVHRAVLRYPARNLAGASLYSHGNEQMVLTPLHHYDLRIDAQEGRRTDNGCEGLEKGDLRRYLTRTSPQGKLSETPASYCERLDFSWVPDLARYASAAAEVCQPCVAEQVTPDFPSNRVAARLKLTQGTLAVDSFDTINGGGYALYQFNGSSTKDKQALANQVSLRLEGLTRPITLVLKSLRDLAASEKKITLQPSTPGETVQIEVLNHVPLAIVNPALDHVHGSSPARLDDFRLYYRLSEVLDIESGAGCEKVALPVPELINGDRNEPICPKTQMKAPAEAVK